MCLRKYIFFIVFIAAGYTVATGQSVRIHALKDNIAKTKNVTERLAAIFSLCEEAESLHSDTLYYYALEAKKTAMAINNIPALRLAGYYEAYSFYRKSMLDSVNALINEHKPKLKQESPGSPVNALFELLEGRYLTRKQLYKEALSLYYQVLSEAEKKQDTLNQMRAMAGIGGTLNRTGDHDGALQWFLKGIHLSSDPGLRNKTIYLYTNTAVIYTRESKYDSASFYVLKGIQYARDAEELGDLANALGMYSGLLMDMNGKKMDKQKYAEAEKPLREALEVSEKIGDPNDIISNMGSLGIFYYDISQSQKGIDICLQAIDMVQKYHLYNKLPNLYEILAKNYGEVKKYRQQAETLQQLAEITDSISQANATEAMAEMNTKYEVQKKENTIILQQLDLVKKDYLIYSSVLLFLLASLVSYFVFINYKKRQRQKATMAIASAEETERKRIAADLHDNLGAYAASIASNVNRLSFSADDSSEAAALQEVRNNSNAIVADLSDTIWALKKESLPLTSVSDRLKIFIQRVQAGYPQVAIDVDEDILVDHSLSPSQGFHLFQTMQEAINNALKHSHCSQIMINVTGQVNEWKISISDNGAGIQETSNHTGGGNGLFNMKNRATEAGWEIEWTENKPNGTIVTIYQPVT